MTDPTMQAAGAAELRRARRHLDHDLDRLCERLGLDPWETWRKPRRLEALAAVSHMVAEVRENAGLIAPVFDELARVRDQFADRFAQLVLEGPA